MPRPTVSLPSRRVYRAPRSCVKAATARPESDEKLPPIGAAASVGMTTGGPSVLSQARRLASRPVAKENQMQSRKIGVLLGGLSSEREVSLRTGEAVIAALRERGHAAVPIYVDRDVDVALRQEQIEVAFIALHGRWGQDGCIQGLLEMMGIPYTGSDVLASALAMHKAKAKELFRLHNLPTPAYYTLGPPGPSDDDLAAIHGDFGFPCVVKPVREGRSVGVSICGDLKELAAAV